MWMFSLLSCKFFDSPNDSRMCHCSGIFFCFSVQRFSLIFFNIQRILFCVKKVNRSHNEAFYMQPSIGLIAWRLFLLLGAWNKTKNVRQSKVSWCNVMCKVSQVFLHRILIKILKLLIHSRIPLELWQKYFIAYFCESKKKEKREKSKYFLTNWTGRTQCPWLWIKIHYQPFKVWKKCKFLMSSTNFFFRLLVLLTPFFA